MSAVALGFGLFVGVAIGPGTEGTPGTTNPMVIRVPAPDEPADRARAAGRGRWRRRRWHGAGPIAAAAATRRGADADDAARRSAAGVRHAVDRPRRSPRPAGDRRRRRRRPTPTTDTPTTTADDRRRRPRSRRRTTLTGTVVHLNPAAAQLHDRHRRRRPARDPLAQARRASAGRSRSRRGSSPTAPTPRPASATRTARRGQVGFDGTVSFSDPRDRRLHGLGARRLAAGSRRRPAHPARGRRPGRGRGADRRQPRAAAGHAAGEQGCGKPPALPKAPQAALEQVGLRDRRGRAGDRRSTSRRSSRASVADSRKLIVSRRRRARVGPRHLARGARGASSSRKLKPGQVLKLAAEIGDGGALSVTTVAGDEGSNGAEDPDLVQRASSRAGGG